MAARADSRVGKGAQSLPVAGSTEEVELTAKGWVIEPSGGKQAVAITAVRSKKPLFIFIATVVRSLMFVLTLPTTISKLHSIMTKSPSSELHMLCGLGEEGFYKQGMWRCRRCKKEIGREVCGLIIAVLVLLAVPLPPQLFLRSRGGLYRLTMGFVSCIMLFAVLLEKVGSHSFSLARSVAGYWINRECVSIELPI